MSEEPQVHCVYEPVTGTWQYIVADPTAREAVIIDSVLDYDKDTGTVSTSSADELLRIVSDQGYITSYILETHAHADHVSASRYLQNVLEDRQPKQKPLVAIGARITQVQQTMATIYQIPQSDLDHAFDHLFADGETFQIGNVQAQILHLPGHTPDHIGYMIGSNIFTGDSIFNPDVGSARCDFPGGSATQLFASTRKLLGCPGHFKLYTGHDYPPEDRDAPLHPSGKKPVPFTTVSKQLAENKHLKAGTAERAFVTWRNERDSGLKDPRLLRISMEVNVRGGRFPKLDEVGDFKITSIPSGVAIS